MLDPHWTQILSALLVPTIAVLAALIAYYQWRTTQNKLKLDLFDKRFAVYDTARRFLSSVMTSGKAKNEEMQKFLAGTREAKWLLSAEIAEYFDKEIWNRAVELQTLDEVLAGLPAGDERTKNVKRQSEIKKWMQDQFKVLNEEFGPFLKLKH